MAERKDPYRNFNFSVEIKGITQARFTDCSGFSSNTDPIEFREGGKNSTMHKLPGQTKYANIVLKHGLTDSHEMYDWYRDVTKGDIRRAHGSIVVYDLDGHTEVARWNFFNAWPTKWDGPDFSARANDVAIETLELAHEGIERA